MSLRSNHAAFEDVWAAFPVTIQLSLAALGLAVAAGVPLGVVAALQPLSRFDNIVMTVTLFGVSMPIFWYGLMMILVFGAFLDWLPIGGLMPIGVEPPRVTGMSVVDAVISGDWHLVVIALRHLALPALRSSRGSPARRCCRCARTTMCGRRARRACRSGASC